MFRAEDSNRKSIKIFAFEFESKFLKILNKKNESKNKNTISTHSSAFIIHKSLVGLVDYYYFLIDKNAMRIELMSFVVLGNSNF